jgi:uncharacterized protein (TIGR03435 family)
MGRSSGDERDGRMIGQARYAIDPFRNSGGKLLVCAALFGLALSAPAQIGAPPVQAESKGPAYEVVSVKPGQPNCGGMSISIPPGRFSARCITVWGLMYNAYAVRSFHDYPPGLPGWGDSAKFDIEAKMSDDSVAAEKDLSPKEREEVGKQMLQALLADRFKLRVHYESRIQAIDQLVVAKGGPKLKQWPAGDKPRGISWGDNRIRVQGEGMDRLAFCLSDVLGRTVVDKTGLSGNFDIDLKWTPDDQQAKPDAGPTLVTAIEEQLGLKLDSAKGPVDSLVVDHLEKPSDN